MASFPASALSSEGECLGWEWGSLAKSSMHEALGLIPSPAQTECSGALTLPPSFLESQNHILL